jgi:uncharacterized integral membrane protein
MGFGIDTFINSIVSAPTVREIFSNPIWSALIIVSVILLIIFAVFRSTFDEDNPYDYTFWRLLLRAGIYISLTIFGFLFLHYKNVNAEFEVKQDINAQTRAVSATITTEPTNMTIVEGQAERSTVNGQAERSTVNGQAERSTVNGQAERSILGDNHSAPVQRLETERINSGTVDMSKNNVFQPKPALMTTNDVIIVKGNNISAERTIATHNKNVL